MPCSGASHTGNASSLLLLCAMPDPGQPAALGPASSCQPGSDAEPTSEPNGPGVFRKVAKGSACSGAREALGAICQRGQAWYQLQGDSRLSSLTQPTCLQPQLSEYYSQQQSLCKPAAGLMDTLNQHMQGLKLLHKQREKAAPPSPQNKRGSINSSRFPLPQTVGLDDFLRSLPTWAALRFCNSRFPRHETLLQQPPLQPTL